MLILPILVIFISAFAGYVIGRWGDNYVNFWIKDPAWIPDHWIYGLALMIIGLFLKGEYKFAIFSFGFGLFVSDLKDFLNLKFYGSDHKDRDKKRFWHID